MKNKYRILFVGYWNVDDGLTHATIFPHLEILKKMDSVEYLHFCNTQREGLKEVSRKKVIILSDDYTPLYSKNLPLNHLNKVYDFIQFPKLIKDLCIKHQINFIISRGAPAGALAYLATKKLKIPFIVESFEPHAEYMKAGGTWNEYDPRYIFQKRWERRQIKKAKALITVTQNYREALIHKGVSKERVFVVPCAINHNQFFQDNYIRNKIRDELKVTPSSILGVYAGKFGGLYLEEEAFEIFQQVFKSIENFELLLLTNTDKDWIKKMIELYQLPSNRIHTRFVGYQKVNDYLNAADFAFALYKSNEVSSFLSPVKLAEYWAVGLPVLLTPKVGDEQDWLEEKGLGVIWDNKSKKIFDHILSYDSEKISKVGRNIRSIEIVKSTYKDILI
ncbi:glycosyltransferase [Marivirga arenosa]|uniref:Glycosyltransferase n=1 Tax=Marivirga arenosa TaxID=3059076 RepID=A0AA49JDA5_9BACT|nr:glycosyltransferase [Marivirga sp. BKB1-2]WKK82553.2 glycosyltransferase [Marivirga sp. BKB1-2]